MTFIIRKMWIIAFAIAFFYVPATSLAQLSLFGSDLRIVSDPTSPGPNTSVRLTAESALMNLTTADITWTVDGKVVLQGAGENELVVTLGNLGQEVIVRVDVSYLGENSHESISLIPGSVDLLFDADSYVPPFFKGRSLPSPGTMLRLVAVPHIAGRSGTIQARELIYTWRQDGETLGSISGKGKSSATIPAPPLFGASDVQVDVRTLDGTYGATASLRIPAIDPEITLYENHPLFGIKYYRALSDRDAIADFETTLAAIPYFVDAPDAAAGSLQYQWSVGGRPITASSSASNQITVNAAGVRGPALISVSLSSLSNFFIDSKHSWNISFAEQAGNFPLSPPIIPSDVFHTKTN